MLSTRADMESAPTTRGTGFARCISFPYYQDERNIDWFSACSFEFDSAEYDALVANCYID